MFLSRQTVQLEIAILVNHHLNHDLDRLVLEVNPLLDGGLFVFELVKVLRRDVKVAFLVHQAALPQLNGVLPGLEAERDLFGFRALLTVLEHFGWLFEDLCPVLLQEMNRYRML